MPWWKSSKSEPPSSSWSSTSPSYSTTPPSRSQRLFHWGRKDRSAGHRQPQLTRQKKIRHAADGSLDLAAREGVSMPVSRTASSLGGASIGERSSSSPMLMPRPLPRPEGVAASPRGEFGSSRLSTPPPGASGRGGERDERGGGGKLGSLLEEPVGVSNSLSERRNSHSNIFRSSELGDVPISVSDHSPKMYAYHDSNPRKNSFRLDVPPRSAPSSMLSSPVLSPRRLSTGDFSPFFAPLSPQPWTLYEYPHSDFGTRFYSHIPGEQLFTSPGSPLHSPKAKSPVLLSANPSPSSSPLHPRLLPSPPSSPLHTKAMPSPLHQKMAENGNVWHDSIGNIAHPLPRPPGSPVSVQSHFPAPLSHQTAPKLEASSISKSNQWEKGKPIGRGTFGTVYIATNRHDGSICAMKEVNLIPDDPKSAECIKQLQQEIRLLSQLKHPNIVRYYGSEIIEDQFYIYLEHVFPGPIHKYVQERMVTESVVRNFTRHILEGLSYLHGANVMHRDIKGANLLVDAAGVVKLADFGMAKHLGEVQGALSLRGTPYWMAPEVLEASMNKERSYDLSVDIWSLGCTVIEMFTGKHPWSGLESAAAMFKIMKSSPEIPQNLSEEGKDFLQKCFRRNPADRPTAIDLLKHPFITNSHQPDVNNCVQAFSGMKLLGTSHNGSNNSPRCVNDPATKGKHLPNSSSLTSSSLPEPTDAAFYRQSPRLTLDVMPASPLYKNHGASCLRGSSADITTNGFPGGSSRMPPIFNLGAPNHKDLLHL